MSSFWDDLGQVVKDAAPELKALASRQLKSTAVQLLNKDKNSPPVQIAAPNAVLGDISNFATVNQKYLIFGAMALGLILILKRR